DVVRIPERSRRSIAQLLNGCDEASCRLTALGEVVHGQRIEQTCSALLFRLADAAENVRDVVRAAVSSLVGRAREIVVRAYLLIEAAVEVSDPSPFFRTGDESV